MMLPEEHASPDQLPSQPTVSVVINNYNYGRYLREAVDSVLAQSYPWTETIVVDDGSTDDSREIIGTYGERIRAVLKDNGGQGSALNAGFRAATGSYVMFLDADDTLLPQAVETAVKLLRDERSASSARFAMRIVDFSGNDTGRRTQPETPLTSAMMFRRAALEKIMPIPEKSFRTCADLYVGPASELVAPAICSRHVFGEYRHHGSNYYSAAFESFDLQPVRREAAMRMDAQRHMHALAARLDETPGAGREVVPDRRLAVLEMILVRLDNGGRSGGFGDALRAWRRGVAAVAHADGTPQKKLLYWGWFFAMLVVPRSIAGILARQFVVSESWARRVLQ